MQTSYEVRAKYEELHTLALAVAKLSLDCYCDPAIECPGCSASMHEGSGSLQHDTDCPIIALRTCLGLDQWGNPISTDSAEPGEL